MHVLLILLQLKISVHTFLVTQHSICRKKVGHLCEQNSFQPIASLLLILWCVIKLLSIWIGT